MNLYQGVVSQLKEFTEFGNKSQKACFVVHDNVYTCNMVNVTIMSTKYFQTRKYSIF